MRFQELEPDSRKALKERYFISIPRDASATVHGVTELSLLVGDASWCALFWCGLQRLEPGSACGSQSSESNHRVWLGPLFQYANGMPLRHAEPPAFVDAMKRAVRATSQQYANTKQLPSRPLHPEYSIMGGRHFGI